MNRKSADNSKRWLPSQSMKYSEIPGKKDVYGETSTDRNFCDESSEQISFAPSTSKRPQNEGGQYEIKHFNTGAKSQPIKINSQKDSWEKGKYQRSYKNQNGGRSFYRSDEHITQGRKYEGFGRTREREQHQYHGKREHQSVNVKILEKTQDIFLVSPAYSLAHCVAADFRMSLGIAVEFRKKFKRIDELLDQKKSVGEVAFLEEPQGRFIYYLITKRFSHDKPQLSDLHSSLIKMREHMKENNVSEIAIPKLGCGLDNLQWKNVHELLLDVFADVDVSIMVCNFTDSTKNLKEDNKKSALYVTQEIKKLVDIKSNTLILLFGSECGYVDNAMKELNEKFRFVDDYKMKPRKIGDVLQVLKYNVMLCIFITKKNSNDSMSYQALFKCLKILKKIFVKEGYENMGFSAFVDDNDNLTVAKVITAFKAVFALTFSQLWVCWPTELQELYNDYFPSSLGQEM